MSDRPTCSHGYTNVSLHRPRRRPLTASTSSSSANAESNVYLRRWMIYWFSEILSSTKSIKKSSGGIGRIGSSGWRRLPDSGAGSGTSPRDSRLRVHLISPPALMKCVRTVFAPRPLRFRAFVRPDPRVCDEHLLETIYSTRHPPSVRGSKVPLR